MLDKNSKEYIAQKQFLQTQSDLFKKHSEERKTINILGIGCSSTSLDDEIRRIPSSHKILQDTLDKAKKLYPDTEVVIRIHILEDMNFDHCEWNYSIDGSYCTRPCWISQKKAEKWLADPLTQLYNDLVDRSDIVLVASPIRWWNASSLYYKLVERLNCIENQKEVYGVDLVHNKLIYNNKIDCISDDFSCRGMAVGNLNSIGSKVFNNLVEIRELKRNQEYNGCCLGGGYAVQFEYKVDNLEFFNIQCVYTT